MQKIFYTFMRFKFRYVGLKAWGKSQSVDRVASVIYLDEMRSFSRYLLTHAQGQIDKYQPVYLKCKIPYGDVMGYKRKTIMGYTIELEVFESGGCGYHKAGDKLKYPEDRGIMCPWLLDSVSSMIRVLRYGGTLPWTYEGTPYEKQIDPDGITTEFVRCPDPTSSGVVLKIIRKKEPGNTH